MSSHYIERDHEENSSRHETVEEPSGDGLPGRSSAPRGGTADSGLVADDTEAFEDPQTGVRISYVLKEREVYECLKQAGCKITGGVNYAAAIVFLAIIAAAVLQVSVSQNRSFFYFLLLLCAAMAAAVVFYSRQTKRTIARKAGGGTAFRMNIFPDHIHVEHNTRQVEIPLDGTSEYAVVKNMLALFYRAAGAKEQKMMILPLRCVDENLLPDIQAMIYAGAKPRKL